MTNKSLKEKFTNNIFVKPLYRKVDRKACPKNVLVSFNVDNTYKLEGDGLNVKRQIPSDSNGGVFIDTKTFDILPGEVNKSDIKSDDKSCAVINTGHLISDRNFRMKMTDSADSEFTNENYVKNSKANKLVQAETLVVVKHIPDTWLRVFPLPTVPKETICSIILRCIVCQIGLATMIILWTVIWTFIIHFFEGPYELQVSLDFEKEQNQLVIDLATELRQITPLSPKWRTAIETRIEEERQLTILAVGRGARVHPGRFWDLSGTFLFTVYVMTALGFGAPVPHTLWGRSSALIYAFVAVPAHIYLMVNASTCLIVKLEECCFRRTKIHEATSGNNEESQSCSRNSEFVKISNNRTVSNKLMRLVCMPCACRCVPLATVVYYACGAVGFGVLRDRPAVDTFMFPLEFTTTGGLDQVESYVRILYGMYVEGAMVLLSCALATLKRHSSGTVNSVVESYRLFHVERSTSTSHFVGYTPTAQSH